MSRRHRATIRVTVPDSRFESPVVGLIINCVMERGKKALASRIVYGALDLINKDNASGDPLELLNRAIENARPRLEVKARRIGGATLQVPMEVTPERGRRLAIDALVKGAKKRKGPAFKALASELRDAAGNQGAAIRKKEEMHKMAQANRAFAHLNFRSNRS